MKILVLTTSTNNVNTFVGSLACVPNVEVSILNYDQKYHQAVNTVFQNNPQALAQYQQQGVVPHIKRDDAAMDDEMLMEAKLGKPDLIVYISAWQGAFVPLNDTLGELNQIAPVVHFLCDAADPPWWPQLKEFERRNQFSLTVAIDGAEVWPGSPDRSAWLAMLNPREEVWCVSKALTRLTPIDTRAFARDNGLSFAERPYAIGYAGNAGTHTRNAIVKRLSAVRGFEHRPRDQHPQSYGQFVDFLQNTRIAVSVPFTGSGAARHVKGRVLEAGFAGCALMEWKNSATAKWFTPRHEYFEYESVEECAFYAEWLATQPKLCRDMAAALNRKVWDEHRPEVFWDSVFAAVGK